MQSTTEITSVQKDNYRSGKDLNVLNLSTLLIIRRKKTSHQKKTRMKNTLIVPVEIDSNLFNTLSAIYYRINPSSNYLLPGLLQVDDVDTIILKR